MQIHDQGLFVVNFTKDDEYIRKFISIDDHRVHSCPSMRAVIGDNTKNIDNQAQDHMRKGINILPSSIEHMEKFETMTLQCLMQTTQTFERTAYDFEAKLVYLWRIERRLEGTNKLSQSFRKP